MQLRVEFVGMQIGFQRMIRKPEQLKTTDSGLDIASLDPPSHITLHRTSIHSPSSPFLPTTLSPPNHIFLSPSFIFLFSLTLEETPFPVT